MSTPSIREVLEKWINAVKEEIPNVEATMKLRNQKPGFPLSENCDKLDDLRYIAMGRDPISLTALEGVTDNSDKYPAGMNFINSKGKPCIGTGTAYKHHCQVLPSGIPNNAVALANPENGIMVFESLVNSNAPYVKLYKRGNELVYSFSNDEDNLRVATIFSDLGTIVSCLSLYNFFGVIVKDENNIHKLYLSSDLSDISHGVEIQYKENSTHPRFFVDQYGRIFTTTIIGNDNEGELTITFTVKLYDDIFNTGTAKVLHTSTVTTPTESAESIMADDTLGSFYACHITDKPYQMSDERFCQLDISTVAVKLLNTYYEILRPSGCFSNNTYEVPAIASGDVYIDERVTEVNALGFSPDIVYVWWNYTPDSAVSSNTHSVKMSSIVIYSQTSPTNLASSGWDVKAGTSPTDNVDSKSYYAMTNETLKVSQSDENITSRDHGGFITGDGFVICTPLEFIDSICHYVAIGTRSGDNPYQITMN